MPAPRSRRGRARQPTADSSPLRAASGVAYQQPPKRIMMSIRLKSPPERIFVSIDESTGRSTISFAPADAGAPILHEGDKTGTIAMREAKAISETYPGATIHGPHFH